MCFFTFDGFQNKPSLLAVKKLAGVASKVNLRNPLHTVYKAHKQGTNPGFETQERRHQKYKTGVSVAPQRVLMQRRIQGFPEGKRRKLDRQEGGARPKFYHV